MSRLRWVRFFREDTLAEQSRYSLFDEELIIRDFFQDRKGGFFVDVGCAWPGKANNTYWIAAKASRRSISWRPTLLAGSGYRANFSTQQFDVVSLRFASSRRRKIIVEEPGRRKFKAARLRRLSIETNSRQAVKLGRSL